jgi:hypothetical protein
LQLSDDNLVVVVVFQVLTYSCDAIPIFNNLTHLTIESNPEVGWQSLPGLLKNSPNLETLIFQVRNKTLGKHLLTQFFKV